jgi:hypothetical protein
LELNKVREWFAPAFAHDEVLRAVLLARSYRLTFSRHLIATLQALAGFNQGRVLLLTDRSIHVASRQFRYPRFQRLLTSYPIRTVPVTMETRRPTRFAVDVDSGAVLAIAGRPFFLVPGGFRLDLVGVGEDIELFLAAGSADSDEADLDESDPGR